MPRPSWNEIQDRAARLRRALGGRDLREGRVPDLLGRVPRHLRDRPPPAWRVLRVRDQEGLRQTGLHRPVLAREAARRAEIRREGHRQGATPGVRVPRDDAGSRPATDDRGQRLRHLRAGRYHRHSQHQLQFPAGRPAEARPPVRVPGRRAITRRTRKRTRSTGRRRGDGGAPQPVGGQPLHRARPRTAAGPDRVLPVRRRCPDFRAQHVRQLPPQPDPAPTAPISGRAWSRSSRS